jgi:micrococcal nuclease
VVKQQYIYAAVVVRIIDGDTVVTDLDLGFNIHWTTHIRLLGINAPELPTPEGIRSRNFLNDLLLHKPVVIQTVKDRPDKYGGRFDGVVWLGEMNVNEEMVKQGLAVRM